ncbi:MULTISPECIES: nucleoside deaminase [unclassified Streptomyces]|uniref:nucleoside deaminase n=1 Tax=unclassified Streptomyces TaxID=2593676 RepID=UPI0029B39615|nr:nucleoside deaminase [Streptomyces sp. DK15]MDX2396323.1 nucleoside deaminase [Streptomyces sp. DK15]
MARAGGEFETAWHTAPEAVRRSLGRAYEALVAGGLAVGAVLTDPTGAVLAEGRNEAYEEPGTDGPGTGPLRGTPLAHAEMNVLGAARTGWTSAPRRCGAPRSRARCARRRPGSAGSAPCATSHRTRGHSRRVRPGSSAASAASGVAPAAGTLWLLAANVMFLRSVAAAATGPGEPEVLRHHRSAEPETAALHDSVPPGLPENDPVEEWLARLWPALTEAARNREGRHRRPR